ncbi:MAG: putative GH43/DUF377 family glycosyl hydrolase [Verrucomicrobiales bacterium]|jgi:predicted GH43/DUF377 family glycosyl hydrolase
MKPIRIHRHEISLLPDSARVIIRPFIPGSSQYITTIIGRALELTLEEASQELASVLAEFDSRHFDIESELMANFERVSQFVFTQRPLATEFKLLIGGLFSGEYALESAAIFNPSMVLHPDQSDAPAGGLRFVMSLRATGEGHVSSIEFRAGTIDSDGRIVIDKPSRFVSAPEIITDPSYRKESFLIKLHEMGFDNEYANAVLLSLGERFNRSELNQSVEAVKRDSCITAYDLQRTLECIQWLADSNYEIRFSEKLALSERIIFPVSPNETNGIEDARFVRFVEDSGEVTYHATYTAYNGRDILPQLITTEDFCHFRMRTLNGDAVQNKGMALFPRRINGRFVMLSRQDNENSSIMFSDNLHYWRDPRIILRPAAMWEAVKVGNCGSPIETEAGWLVITHGVGPMRKYCIGAALLDLDDPSKVIGRLRDPLLCPQLVERDGYVPNVVYSCGSLLHGRQLVLPFAVSDHTSSIASVSLDDLLQALQSGVATPLVNHACTGNK